MGWFKRLLRKIRPVAEDALEQVAINYAETKVADKTGLPVGVIDQVLLGKQNNDNEQSQTPASRN